MQPIVIAALIAPVAIVFAEFTGTTALDFDGDFLRCPFFLLLGRRKFFAVALSFVAVSFGMFMEYFYRETSSAASAETHPDISESES